MEIIMVQLRMFHSRINYSAQLQYAKKDKLDELFAYITTLKEIIDIFKGKTFRSKEVREFSYTPKILDIL